MILINGCIRYLILCAVCVLLYSLESGIVSFLFLDLTLAMQFVLFFVASLFYIETLNPQTDKQLQQVRFAGSSGFILAILIPLVMSVFHCFQYLESPKALGQLAATVVITFFNATLIYFSFFRWAVSASAFEGLAVSQNYLRLRKIWVF